MKSTNYYNTTTTVIDHQTLLDYPTALMKNIRARMLIKPTSLLCEE